MKNSKSNVQHTSESLPIGNNMLSDAVFRPMLFSTPMVQALLNGTKTQTRRLVKFPNNYFGGEVYPNGTWGLKYETKDDCGNKIVKRLNSKFNIGDIIWVRETFCEGSIVDRNENKTDTIIFKATYKNEFEIYDHEDELIDIKWKPSLFMKKDACRLWLKVTNVRIEQLHDISEIDAIDEGILSTIIHSENLKVFKVYESETAWTDNPIISYQSLWQKINGTKSWYENPWVFVYKFEVLSECPYGFR